MKDACRHEHLPGDIFAQPAAPKRDVALRRMRSDAQASPDAAAASSLQEAHPSSAAGRPQAVGGHARPSSGPPPVHRGTSVQPGTRPLVLPPDSASQGREEEPIQAIDLLGVDADVEEAGDWAELAAGAAPQAELRPQEEPLRASSSRAGQLRRRAQAPRIVDSDDADAAAVPLAAVLTSAGAEPTPAPGPAEGMLGPCAEGGEAAAGSHSAQAAPPKQEGGTAEASAALGSAALQQAVRDAPTQEENGSADAEAAAASLQQPNGPGRRRTELEKLQLWAGDP